MASVAHPRELKIGLTGCGYHLVCLRLKQNPDGPQGQKKRWDRREMPTIGYIKCRMRNLLAFHPFEWKGY